MNSQRRDKELSAVLHSRNRGHLDLSNLQDFPPPRVVIPAWEITEASNLETGPSYSPDAP